MTPGVTIPFVEKMVAAIVVIVPVKSL